MKKFLFTDVSIPGVVQSPITVSILGDDQPINHRVDLVMACYDNRFKYLRTIDKEHRDLVGDLLEQMRENLNTAISLGEDIVLVSGDVSLTYRVYQDNFKGTTYV